ncbi:MAG TPA: glycosyltransferase family 4 protein [Methylobacter sp.]
MPSRKICFFVTEDWYFCSHRLPLAVAAKNAGFDVTVITRVVNHGELIRDAGIRVIPFNLSRRSMNPFKELVAILRLCSIYRSERPDIVHHVAVKPVLYGSIAAQLIGIPHVINALAGLGWLFTSTSKRARLLQAIIRRAFYFLLSRSAVIVQNDDDVAALRDMGVAQQRINLIRGSGVNMVDYAPLPEGENVPIVVLPARLLWDKGVGEFVEAAGQLKRRGVHARFVLVGEPDAENPASVSTQQLIAWQKDGVVEWWGRREDMPQVLAQSHIVCLPSYREGLPKSLLEAASCGRPIVTTDVPGCREIVRDGDNGILVEVRNSMALADALEKLLADPELRQQMGRRGRERVMNEFSQEIIDVQILALYREAIS